ncbi:hypothetical protein HK101_010843 [Irineochytrium annulatum]|nr:hypothetical protein HK101_010843 [Irineochytrium annulatum]
MKASPPSYESQAYWDAKWLADASELEWLKTDVAPLSSLILDHLPPSPALRSALHLGSGTSTLGIHLAVGHGLRVTNADYSVPVLDAMRSRFPEHEWVQLDVTDFARLKPSLPLAYYDFIVEKCLLDTLLTGREEGDAFFAEYFKAMGEVCGRYVWISYSCERLEGFVGTHLIPGARMAPFVRCRRVDLTGSEKGAPHAYGSIYIFEKDV